MMEEITVEKKEHQAQLVKDFLANDRSNSYQLTSGRTSSTGSSYS